MLRRVMLTMQQLADIAGVSKTAVSHAVNNTGRLSHQLRTRLLELIRQHNYTPRPAYASLAKLSKPSTSHKSSLRIAVLLDPDEGFDVPWVDHYKREFATWGYSAIPVSLKANTALCDIHAELSKSKFIAVLIHTHRRYTECINYDWHNLVVICRCWPDLNNPYHSVYFRAFDGVILAYSKLRERGYSRIGSIILTHKEYRVSDDDERLSACISAQCDLPSSEFIPPCTDYNSIQQWSERYKPDAIIGFNDGTYWLAKPYNRSAYFCSLHAYNSNHSHPRLSGVLFNRHLLAQCTVKFMDYCIKHHDYGRPSAPLQISIPHQWIWRS